jgi:hypothetical protein
MSYQARLDNSKKLIFIHIPKCAGMSVQQWFNNYFESIYVKNHAPLTHFDLTNSISFTIVRNPYDRAVSWYNFRCRILNKRRNKHPYYAKEYEIAKKGIDSWIDAYFDVDWFDNKHGSNMHGPEKNNYFKPSTPQVDWISINNKISIDHVIKLENLKKRKDKFRKCFKVKNTSWL